MGAYGVELNRLDGDMAAEVAVPSAAVRPSTNENCNQPDRTGQFDCAGI